MAAKEKTKQSKVDPVKVVEEISSTLLGLMGSKANAEVSLDKENDAVLVDIQTDDESGLLIGSRGDTLQSLQTVIGMIYKSKTEEWKRILVNVADWRERQQEKLDQLAKSTADRAVETGEPAPLYNLTPAERRLVHMALVDNKDVETESVGEGKERHLVVNPKK